MTPHNKPLSLTARLTMFDRPPPRKLRALSSGESAVRAMWPRMTSLDRPTPAIPAGYGLVRYAAGSRMRSSVLAASVVMLFATPSTALSFATVTLAELAESADLVAIVQIVSGELISLDDEQLCGARYRARVLEAVKGPFAEGDSIEFGPHGGKTIGGKYLLFASEKPAEYSSVLGPESVQEANRQCFDLLPKFQVMQAGIAALDVSWTIHDSLESESVLFDEDFVAPPPDLERREWSPFDNRMESKRSWARSADVLRYLRSIVANEE